jgi:hypothetical protein
MLCIAQNGREADGDHVFQRALKPDVAAIHKIPFSCESPPRFQAAQIGRNCRNGWPAGGHSCEEALPAGAEKSMSASRQHGMKGKPL